MKSAESVHPNLTGAPTRGAWGAGGGSTERKAGGMFSQCFCRLQRCCANIWVCWTAKLKQKIGWSKQRLWNRWGVCVRRGSSGGGKMDKEVEKDWKRGKTMRLKMERWTVAEFGVLLLSVHLQTQSAQCCNSLFSVQSWKENIFVF